MNSAVIVWDDLTRFPEGATAVFAWRRFTDNSAAISIPRYLEDHADRLRTKYLQFIHDLGEYRVGDRSVVEHLDTGTGFSFWWMTHLAEKSPFKSPRIYDCLRLLAVEELLIATHAACVELVSADPILARSLRALCTNLGIAFSWRRTSPTRLRLSARRVYRALPQALQGVVSLAKYLVTRWPLRRLQAPAWFGGKNAVFMCSYFFNIDRAEAADGRFYARQWEGIPRLIHETGARTNWLQHFLPEVGPRAKTASRWLRRFNHDADKQGHHAFLESYLSWGIVRRVAKRLLWLRRVAQELNGIADAFRPVGSATWLWPMLERDWAMSLKGATAISNCLWVELFDSALGQMPRQTLGFYLCENQGWERALIDAWRRHGHGKLVGVPHATVPFWHLNYFDDPRTIRATQRCAMPLPDRIALNGPMAWTAYVDAGYPVDQLVEVEAMRYQYLNLFAARNSVARSRRGGGRCQYYEKRPRRILILGDSPADQTVSMLKCMERALPRVSEPLLITLKPHPAASVSRADHPTLQFDLTDRPLGEIIPKFDMAFSSNATSAGIDALLAGLPVAVILDATTFNLSPLRAVAGVCFVTTPDELADALNFGENHAPTPSPANFFWLDTDFPKWRRLLSGARQQ